MQVYAAVCQTIKVAVVSSCISLGAEKTEVSSDGDWEKNVSTLLGYPFPSELRLMLKSTFCDWPGEAGYSSRIIHDSVDLIAVLHAIIMSLFSTPVPLYF